MGDVQGSSFKSLLFMGFFMFFVHVQPVMAVNVGDKLGELRISHMERGQLDGETMKGKVTLINFWATWCEACKTELREMEKHLKIFVKDTRVNLVFVSLDREPSLAKDWFKDRFDEKDLWLSKLYTDPTLAVADKLQLDAFPTTLILGEYGEVLYLQKGFKPGEGTIEKLVQFLKDRVESLG